MTASKPRSRSGCDSLVSEPRFRSLTYFVSNLIIVMSSVRIMPPRRDPRPSTEPSFPDISQFGEAIASAIQSVIHPPQRTPLETIYNLKLPFLRVMRDMQVLNVGLSMWRKLSRLWRVRAALLLSGGWKPFLGFWKESLLHGGNRKLTGGHPKRKQIGEISSSHFIRDLFLRRIWIRRSRSLPTLNRRSCLLLCIIEGSQICPVMIQRQC